MARYTEKIIIEVVAVREGIDDGSVVPVVLANSFDVIANFLIGSYRNRDLTGLARDPNCDIVAVGNDLGILLSCEAEGYSKSRLDILKRRVERKIVGLFSDRDSSMYESDGQQNT